VNYDNSLVVTITVTCDLWAPSSGDHLFSCGAIYLPPHNTDAYHPRVHIRKVPGLWRINYTPIDTVGSSNANLVSMLAEHGNTQLLLYMVVQTTQEW